MLYINAMDYRARSFSKETEKREYGAVSIDLRYNYMNNQFMSNKLSEIKNNKRIVRK